RHGAQDREDLALDLFLGEERLVAPCMDTPAVARVVDVAPWGSTLGMLPVPTTHGSTASSTPQQSSEYIHTALAIGWALERTSHPNAYALVPGRPIDEGGEGPL